MTLPTYYRLEQDLAQNLIQYWKARGIDVKTKIEPILMNDYNIYCLRSDLVMRVPKYTHNNVYGHRLEIKGKMNRKWN